MPTRLRFQLLSSILVSNRVPFMEKMAVILSKTMENPNKLVTVLLRFPIVRLWNRQTIVMAIAMADHSKTKKLEIQTSKRLVFQCVQYSNVWNSSPHHSQFLLSKHREQIMYLWVQLGFEYRTSPVFVWFKSVFKQCGFQMVSEYQKWGLSFMKQTPGRVFKPCFTSKVNEKSFLLVFIFHTR